MRQLETTRNQTLMNPLQRIARSVSYRAAHLVNLCHPRRWKRYDRPRAVFMSGMPRSGTSLAKRYLGNHPGLVMAPAGTYRDSWEFARTAPPDKITLAKNTRDLPRLREIHVLTGNLGWFLCIVRDPRDELVSLLETHIHPEIPRDRSFWDMWAARHRDYIEFAETYSRRGTKAALARYEDLALQPEKVKEAFLHWLGLSISNLKPEYEPDPEIGREPGGAEDWKTHRQRKVHTQSIGRWRNVENPEWAKLIALWEETPGMKELMLRFGYADEPGEIALKVSGLEVLK